MENGYRLIDSDAHVIEPAYGERLAEAGVLTQVSRYDGMNHGFFQMYGIVDMAKQALEESATWLKERFA